jgi:hypothetical protein
MWNTVSYFEGKIQIEGVWELSGEEYFDLKEGKQREVG